MKKHPLKENYERFFGKLREADMEIPEPIQRLIQSMIDSQTQRKTVRLKDENGFNKLLSDFKPAIDQKMLMLKQNPIDKQEVWISLGPSASDKIKF